MMCDLLRVGEKDHIMDLWLLSLLFFETCGYFLMPTTRHDGSYLPSG
jgi:hypothetical protein